MLCAMAHLAAAADLLHSSGPDADRRRLRVQALSEAIYECIEHSLAPPPTGEVSNC